MEYRDPLESESRESWCNVGGLTRNRRDQKGAVSVPMIMSSRRRAPRDAVVAGLWFEAEQIVTWALAPVQDHEAPWIEPFRFLPRRVSHRMMR